MPKRILPHCVLSKITVSNNFMEIHMGGGVFKLGNPEGRGAEAVLEIQGDGGGVKNCAFRRGGMDFFWNNPLHYLPQVWSKHPGQKTKYRIETGQKISLKGINFKKI